MRQYEAMYILDPTLEEEQQTALIERFQALVSDQGGEVQHLERWERRRTRRCPALAAGERLNERAPKRTLTTLSA